MDEPTTRDKLVELAYAIWRHRQHLPAIERELQEIAQEPDLYPTAVLLSDDVDSYLGESSDITYAHVAAKQLATAAILMRLGETTLARVLLRQLKANAQPNPA